MRGEELRVFTAAAHRRNFGVIHAAGYEMSNGRWRSEQKRVAGGVVVLIKMHIPHHPMEIISGRTQMVLARVGHWQLMVVYTPPTAHDRTSLAMQVQATAIGHRLETKRWIAVGDWNDELSESPAADALRAIGG